MDAADMTWEPATGANITHVFLDDGRNFKVNEAGDLDQIEDGTPVVKLGPDSGEVLIVP